MATIGGAYATIMATRRRLKDDCHSELELLRRQNTQLAKDLYELRMHRFRETLEMVAPPLHDSQDDEGGEGA